MKLKFFILSLCLPFLAHAQEQASRPTPSQAAWQQAEIGVIFHYDLHVFDTSPYSQNSNRISPIADYNIFNPAHLDTDQWIKAAKDAGAKFAIITATHETGFGLWQSDVNPYCMKALKWRDGKGDIVADFVASCHKYGIQPGIYIGIRWNSFLGIHNFKVDSQGQFAENRQQWYRHYCEQMVTELCSRYGKLFMIWFDGGADDPRGLGPDVEPIVNRLQPGCLFYHNTERADVRWGGSESGTVGYPCYSAFPQPYSHTKDTDDKKQALALLKHGDPNGKYVMPAMADTPLRGANGRHEWFWEPGDEKCIYPVDSLVSKYEKSVGRNATLMLGLTPDNTGVLPAADVDTLRCFGKKIQSLYASPLASATGNKKRIDIKTNGKTKISRCVIAEDITAGERVRAFRLLAKTDGKWLTINSGSSIGNKRIVTFNPVNATQVRLIIDKSIGTPNIKTFQIFSK